MAQTVQYLLTFDPTDSVVGNGYLGQVYAIVENSYSWRLITQNLPGQAFRGVFPNPENPNSIKLINRTYVLPYRGGTNTPAPVPPRRPDRGPVGITAIGIVMYGPDADQKVLGGKSTLWNINAVVAGIFGDDQYSGHPSPTGEYHYHASKFITNNAWGNIPGFLGQYTHADGHSKIVGWAVDGYPIYGPYGYADPMNSDSLAIQMTSGYTPSVQPNRPVNTEVITYGATTNSNQLRVRNAQAMSPGIRLTGGSLPGTVKVLSVDKNYLTLDTTVTVASDVSLQGVWPLGIFIEDYVYSNNTATLDRHNGRYCVTPEFPNGTYAYFTPQTADGDPVYPYFVGNTLYGQLAITPPPPPPPLSWITPPGNLGTLSQGVYFQVQLQAVANNEQVYYKVIAGEIPAGMQVTSVGYVSGVPTLSGAASYGQDFTSKFTVRAYTLIGTAVDQFIDETFTITIAGARIPQFLTPAGEVGSFYDGSPIDPIQLEFTGPLLNTITRIVGGSLPVGLSLSATGVISGYVGLQPNVDQPPGYDATPEDLYGYDFLATSSSYNYQFTVEITDGRQSNLRTFEIFVASRNTLTADDTTITADDTLITADQTNDRIPFLTNPQGSIGTVVDDNWFAYKFEGLDLDGQTVRYLITEEYSSEGNWSIPPGLTLDPLTGWLYGYIPQQAISRQTFTLAIRVGNVNDITVVSNYYFYTLTVVSGIDTRLEWLSPYNLGTIVNGATSLFEIRARSLSGALLAYRLDQGSNSQLPEGLRLLQSGHIVGNVSFNTFALDLGTTTFDVTTRTTPTTFDLTYRFTVNAYSPNVQQLRYRLASITVINAGQQFTSTPTINISSPDQDGVPATAGAVTLTFVPGKGLTIASVAVGYSGYGYVVPPTITVEGGGGIDAQLSAVMVLDNTDFLISETHDFEILIDRKYNEPLDTLYIKALPPEQSKNLVENLTQNPTLIPIDKLYRADDSNFGIAKDVSFVQAYGLPASTLEAYQKALNLNHYWKHVVLGPIKTAQATDASGNVIYEVIYSEIIDNLVNSQGVSVGKEVTLAYPVTLPNDTVIDVVYPNSLSNMRQQVINSLGDVSNLLPLWMTSFQTNGQQLGYTAAWVIAYLIPGSSKQIAFDIDQTFGYQLDQFDFEIDRYQLGKNLSHNWDPIYDSTGGAWVPPARATTFDLNSHYWPVTVDEEYVFYGGLDYQARDIIKILGSALGGLDSVNDLYIHVLAVDVFGTIVDFYVVGEAPAAIPTGYIYYNVSGQLVNRTAPVTQANFNIAVSNNVATVFDGGSVTFVAPADIITTGDTYDKYLVFPKRNILE